MRKMTLFAIAVAVVAMVGHSVTRSEHVSPAVADKAMMPSPFQMMSDSRDLQSMPFVAP